MRTALVIGAILSVLWVVGCTQGSVYSSMELEHGTDDPCGERGADPSRECQEGLAAVTLPVDALIEEVIIAGPQPKACGCLLGDGAYCGQRALDLAAEAGCDLDALVTSPDMLYSCSDGVWSELEECAGSCEFDASDSQLDDQCVLPECDCFVQVAWCGSGAEKKANQMGCQIPLLPKHRGDILYCPGGEWSVKESCTNGCTEAPDGVPDFCKSASDYFIPLACGKGAYCSNGNHTSSHSGKDAYAYDFAMAVGTSVRAMRGGVVHRVRIPAPPGSACHNGGGSSCANYANTVEVKHTDGTIGLYMHLRNATVSVGERVKQGDELGKSGNSGWSTGPHLHVQVQQNCGIWWCQSIPFKFGESNSIIRGTSIASKNCPAP